jgi:hypothetical protein
MMAAAIEVERKEILSTIKPPKKAPPAIPKLKAAMLSLILRFFLVIVVQSYESFIGPVPSLKISKYV